MRPFLRNSVLWIVPNSSIATYAVWLLSHYHDIEDALIREVASLPSDAQDQDLRQSKLLCNVVQETLRLRSPIGQALPRCMPPGGADFAGYYIPESVIVGYVQRSLCRGVDV